MHIAPLIHDLAIILGVAGAVTYIFQRIQQPVVLGYIIAGIIVGPYTPPFHLIEDLPNIRTWAELGVVFLMFSLGLEFSFRKLAQVGVSAGATAIFEVVLMILLGFGCGRIFGWSSSDSLFLGAMLSISSTTIIIKALDELGLKKRRFAEIIFGVLIVEDLVAILVLVALPMIEASQRFSIFTFAISAGKLLLVVGGWFIGGYFLIPRMMKQIGKHGTDEMLMVVSLGLCLSLVVLAANLNYSVALGAFIMGSILAESSEVRRIETLIQPLRDIFGAVFFVSVGMLLDPMAIWQHKWAILVISGVTILGKIVSTTLGSLLTGQTLKTSVQVGFGLAQIGEFSFIIASLGVALGVTSDFLYPVGVAVSLLTTFTTPYLIKFSYPAVEFIERKMPVSILVLLNRYVEWNEIRRASGTHKSEFYRRLLRWFLNGLVVTVVGVLIAELGVPVLSRYMSDPFLLTAATLVCVFLCSAPFIWGMFFTFRNYHFSSGAKASELPKNLLFIFFGLLTVAWFVILSLALFSAKYVIFVSLLAGFVLYSRTHRQLEAAYQWFESQFLSGFKGTEAESSHNALDPPVEDLRRLVPWDAHLVNIHVHPDSDISENSIADSQLRNKYGLNIVAIQRGSKTIVSPMPDQQIMPHDGLLVLGTDEQVEDARSLIEKPPGLVESRLTSSDYVLKRIQISSDSPLVGKSIRESKIREIYRAMVVGIERDGKRIMNPNSDLVLQREDSLWVVGHVDRVRRLGIEKS